MWLDIILPIKADRKSAQQETSAGDSQLKSLLKTISWRIVGTLDTMVIAYFITGEVVMAVSIGSVEVFSKLVLYYFHERAWSRIKIGS